MNCKWIASDQPRIVVGRHGDDCPGEECAGCLPCTERHCPICRRVHADGACAECVAVVRADLHEIALRCGSLSDEVEHRGINGEAMMLLGPVANAEARQYVEASYLAGRLPEGWIEASHGRKCPRLVNEACVGCAGDERHPFSVLGGWDMIWRDFLDHQTELAATLPRLVDYLDQQMTYMAGVADVPFEDFAKDLRGCRGHLQDILGDQNQGDRANIGCFECGADLERRLTDAGFEDHWTCQQCRRRYTDPEYHFALRAHLETLSAKEAS